ncbi:MAG: GDP-mannose 4,6-dehydratase [Acidobacteria bacterium]|nr:GDP-mannose 4,6-dehydratase [Acidobacteriota bacterium]
MRTGWQRPTLITGGAGFVGCNLADRLLSAGRPVTVLDDLSRPGVETNLAWLREHHGDRLRVVRGDVRDAALVRDALDGAGQVFHFAAQVAVTTSLHDPLADFEVNARGTLTVLEQIRRQRQPAGLIYTSTNKVYGALPDLELVREDRRYRPVEARVAERGIAEDRPLDFHSPYGCSKGAADQYVLDYARTFGIPAAVFRMSCIYGPHQFGTEDQGWVAHFLIRALEGHEITIYGDGLQVRDLLYVEDLVDAFLAVERDIGAHAGRAFNVGGGPANAVSLLEVLEEIAGLEGAAPRLAFEPWRPGDQRYYVSDTSRLGAATGWRPHTPVHDGLRHLRSWLVAARAPGRPAAAHGGA